MARPGSSLWHWPSSFWQTFLPRFLVETGFITVEDREAFEKTWAEASNDPAAFVQMPPVYELIAIKE